MRKSVPIEVVVHYPQNRGRLGRAGQACRNRPRQLCDRKNRAAELPHMAEAGTVSGGH